jgi:DNA-binding XRE family transcriptional regulator
LASHIEGGIVTHVTKIRRRRPDFLDELIAGGARDNPAFPRRVDAALDRRELLRRLVRRREALGLSQEQVAATMGTSQPAVARLEAGEVDARGSTIERFAAAVGQRVEYRLAGGPRRRAGASPRG